MRCRSSQRCRTLRLPATSVTHPPADERSIEMKRLRFAAASAAVIGLAGCTHATAPDAARTGHGTGTLIAPVSCSQQYRTWNHGQGKGLMDALDAVTSAATARHPQVLTAALKHVRPSVAKAAHHPIPACADPRGYWSVLLMHVNAAAAGPAPASSVRAALRDVAKIHHQLLAEVRQTAQ